MLEKFPAEITPVLQSLSLRCEDTVMLIHQMAGSAVSQGRTLSLAQGRTLSDAHGRTLSEATTGKSYFSQDKTNTGSTKRHKQINSGEFVVWLVAKMVQYSSIIK